MCVRQKVLHVAVDAVMTANRIYMFGNVQDCVPKKFGVVFFNYNEFFNSKKMEFRREILYSPPLNEVSLQEIF